MVVPVGVALLDSGIALGHPHLEGIVIGSAVSLLDDPDPFVDPSGHGTATAAAIHQLSPQVVFHVVRLLDVDGSCPEPRLITALARVLDLPVTLVNASLGLPAWSSGPELAAIVRQLLESGRRLVAPAASASGLVHPGAYRGVDGVVVDVNVPRERPQRRTGADGRPVWFASPHPRPRPGVPRERNVQGVSFAAANVTGHLARSGGIDDDSAVDSR